MTREWAPGDVALVEGGCWANRKVAIRLAEGWAHVNGVNVDGDGVVSPVRPLVVIDPEDRAQVQRLALAMRDHAPDPLADWEVELLGDDRDLIETTDAMQAALREFANPTPPKPDEPKGLGAVVEDAEGTLWVRARDVAHPWRPSVEKSSPYLYAPWSDITAVRVLSEGVGQS